MGDVKCAIMQPTYLPWLGYFQLIDQVDIFVFFDNVQFIKKSWHQKNKIKTAQGEAMLTVSVKKKGLLHQKILDVKLNDDMSWKKKHLSTIELAYKKAPFFNEYFPGLKEIYERDLELLFDLNSSLINYFCEILGIDTKIVRSSELEAVGSGDELVIDICKKLDSRYLFNASGAKEVLNLEKFKENDIHVEFQDFAHPSYSQLYGEFVPYMSVLDVIFNVGSDAIKLLREK